MHMLNYSILFSSLRNSAYPVCPSYNQYHLISACAKKKFNLSSHAAASSWVLLVALTTAVDYLFEDEPLVNKFISVPKDQSKGGGFIA